MADRISSFDTAYITGDLSIFPEALDDRDVLYEATNNTKVPLKQTLASNAKIVLVESTAGFPDTGQIRISSTEGGPYELIAYGQKTVNAFVDLQRGFAGSKQTYWTAKTSYVSNVVSADHHNAPKDALINIEKDLGTKENPDVASLNGILKWQEIRFLTPRPIFRASVRKGKAPLKIRFQNFTTGHVVRNFWDFGDGTTSVEKSPSHTYVAEGDYTVKLNVITSTGGQGVCTKTAYITIDNNETPAFMYVDSISDPYSVESATLRTQGNFPPDNIAVPTEPKEFIFVDQTDGDIVERHWIFGDGTSIAERDPDRHWITHIYSNPSTTPGYYVSCLTVLSNGRLKRAQLGDPLIVL